MAEKQYFKRIWSIQVEDNLFDGLDVEFNVKKSLRPVPNTCELTVYGLAESTRRALEALNIYDPKRTKGEKLKQRLKKAPGRAPKEGKIRVEVRAGYEDTGLSLIFLGDLRRGLSKPERPEVAFEIRGEDGGTSFQESRINESFPAGTTKLAVVRACADAMGLGLGNLRAVEASLTSSYSHGTAVTGPASHVLKGVLRGAGITYSIQNGTLQFFEPNQETQTIAIPLRQGTGLIGSPELDSTGALLVNTLMIPNVAPGAYVQLDSKRYKGVFYVKDMATVGDSSGDEWGHRLELYPG